MSDCPLSKSHIKDHKMSLENTESASVYLDFGEQRWVWVDSAR